MSNNYQFVIDSLWFAEEPHLGQLLELIRSNQSIEVIADTWRSNNFLILDQLQAASLLKFDGATAGNNFGGSEMGTSQPGTNIGQSNAQTN